MSAVATRPEPAAPELRAVEHDGDVRVVWTDDPLDWVVAFGSAIPGGATAWAQNMVSSYNARRRGPHRAGAPAPVPHPRGTTERRSDERRA